MYTYDGEGRGRGLRTSASFFCDVHGGDLPGRSWLSVLFLRFALPPPDLPQKRVSLRQSV